MTNERKAVAKDVAYYSGATFIVQNISFVLAIFIRRILGPEGMGVWALLQVFLKYASYANLGIFDAMYRDIPMRRGAGDFDGIKETKGLSLGFTLVASCAASVLIVFCAFYYKNRISTPLFWGLIVLSGLNVLEKLNNLYIGFLYAEKRFDVVSRFKVASALINAVFIILLTPLFGLYGYLIAMLLSTVFNLSYLWFMTGRGVFFEWRLDGLKKLLAFGVPYLGYSFVNTIFMSIDRIVVGKFMGLPSLGVYTLATMGTGYLAMFPNILQQVISPRVLERMTEPDGSNSIISRQAESAVRIASVYFSIFIGFIWIAAPFFCKWVLPKFETGIPALKILIFGAAFSGLSLQLYSTLIGRLKHWNLIPLCLFLTSVIWICCWWMKSQITLTQIAMLVTIGNLTHYLYSSSLVYSATPKGMAIKGLYEGLANVIPLVITLITVIILDSLIGQVNFISTFYKLGLYILSWFAWLPLLEKRCHIIALAKEIFLNRRQK